jgi:hypothetical protein
LEYTAFVLLTKKISKKMISTIVSNILDVTSLKVYGANALAMLVGTGHPTIDVVLKVVGATAAIAYTVVRTLNEWKAYKSKK